MPRKPKKASARRQRPKAAKKAAPKKAAKPAKRARARPAPAPKAGKELRAKAPPVARAREEFEEETVCSLEFLSDGRSFVARLDTIRGGMREHKAPSFTDLLELVAEDLREEFSEV